MTVGLRSRDLEDVGKSTYAALNRGWTRAGSGSGVGAGSLASCPASPYKL
ncbi:O-methyltransferase [Aspergillus luchuensis]|uniref:O-methyltransferase n=1 Tax=Aspergillus kawachii TaxID=1069201 RepID=A0A146FAV8_ASPKA|nr:O-methyltransferase [Aspergillus luchuensis]